MKRKAWSMAAIALCVLLAFGTLAACKDKTKNPPDDNGSDPVYAITLDRTTLGLELGSADKLTATLQKDGETTDEQWAAEWTSSDTTVATVAGGTVTAVKAGTTTVTVSFGSVSATCAVTVTASYQPGIVLGAGDAATLAVKLGSAFKMQPQIRYNGVDYTDGTFAYRSADTDVLTAADDGTLTGVTVGETTLTVTADWRGFDQSVLSENYTVRVSEDLQVEIVTPSATKLAATAAQIEGYDVPNTVKLTANVRLNGQAVEDPAITWTSSNPDVASVSADGTVTGKASGSTQISVTYTHNGEPLNSLPVTIEVEFPNVDRTDSLDLGDVDASLTLTEGGSTLRIQKADVFGASGPAIQAIYDVTGTSTQIAATADTATGDVIVTDSGLATGERVWEIRNAEYAYRVKAFVATKVLKTGADLIAAFGSNLVTNQAEPKLYGAGAYYVLGDNIDASQTVRGEDKWLNTNGITDSGFQGIFDGRGKTINGLTVKNGGLFGYLANGSVVRNFALTNLTLDNTGGWQPSALAHFIYGNATIENVFIQINGATDNAKTNGNLRGIANLVRGSNTGVSPLFKNVVLYMNIGDATTKEATSLVSEYNYGNYAKFENMHIVSDYTLSLASKGGDRPTVTAFSGSLTRYGDGGAYASFAARYTNADSALDQAGLSADYWTYNAAIGYPVFTSYYENYYDADADIQAAFDELPTTLTYDSGETHTYTVPAACGDVTLSLENVTGDGVTVSGKTLAVADSYAGGTFTLKITSDSVADLGHSIAVTVYTANEIAERKAKAAFAAMTALPKQDYNAGTAAEWAPPADAGTVTLTLSDGAPSGVTVEDGKLKIAEVADAGAFSVTVKNETFSLTATVDFEVLLPSTEIDTLLELSKATTANEKDIQEIAYDKITADNVRGLAVKKAGDETYTTLTANDDYTAAAGKVTLTAAGLTKLSVGANNIRLQLNTEVREYTNVMVYTKVITTADELMDAFGKSNVDPSGKGKKYGAGTYYVLGNNIEATGTLRTADGTATASKEEKWTSTTDGGFAGTFDGKGYTIDGITLFNGGLFGNLAQSAVVKNFALTNVVLDSLNNWNTALLAHIICDGAQIENVFLHVGTITAKAEGSQLRGIANIPKGKGSQMKNAVVVLDATGKNFTNAAGASSYLTKTESGNYVNCTNVHIISNLQLAAGSYTLGQPEGTKDITLHSVADGYSGAMSGDYWTTADGFNYPVFTSAVPFLTQSI